jgi:uncharacterized protein
VTGTLLNAAAILIGGALGLSVTRQLSLAHQTVLRILMGAFTVFIGLNMTWQAVNGTFLQILKQLLVVLLALMLGNLTGRLLHLQKAINRCGQYAREKIAAARPEDSHRFNDGFITGAILFCLAPLAILGPLADALGGNVKPLAVKALMDGLATMAFVTTFGWSIILSIIPLIAWQGTLALLAKLAQPWLDQHALIDPINATAGLLVFSIALVILELKKIELANYLPALICAPLLAWLWR